MAFYYVGGTSTGVSTVSATARLAPAVAGVSTGTSTVTATGGILGIATYPRTVKVYFKGPAIGWTELTCQIMGAGWSRGANEDRGPLTVPDLGLATLYLIDPARDLDPANSVGAWFGQFDLGVELRIDLAGFPAFHGRVDSIDHELRPPTPGAEGVPLCRLAATDWVAPMAAITTSAAAPWPQESAGARIAHYATAASLPGVTQQIETAGTVTIAAGGVVNDLWSDALAVTQAELGSIEFKAGAAAGAAPRVIFWARSSIWATVAPTLHLGCDDPDSIDELALEHLELLSELSTVRNSVTITIPGAGALAPYSDAASVAKYGQRSLGVTIPLVLQADANAWAALVLAQSKNPAHAFRQVQVRAFTGAAMVAIESLPLFRGRVHVYQDHHGPTIDSVRRLLGVAWEVDDTLNAVATLTLGQDYR